MIEFALTIFLRVTVNSEVERLQEASHITGNKDYFDAAIFVSAQNFVCLLTFEDNKNHKIFLIRLCRFSVTYGNTILSIDFNDSFSLL